MIYNKRVALDFLGKACSDLNILRDRKFTVNENDFAERFHRIIFAVLQDLALEQDMKTVDGVTVDGYLRGMDKQYAVFKQNNGVDFIEEIKKLSENSSLDYSYRTLKKCSILRDYQSKGIDITDIYNESLVDLDKIEEQRKRFDKLTITDIKRHYKMKIIEVENSFKEGDMDTFSFEGGDDLDELLDRCETEPLWGKAFQSEYMNTIFRGMMGQKFYIRSGGTGSGKSRQSLANLCHLSVDMLFNPDTNQWEVNKNGGENVLFISTELVQDEVQLAMLAFVACVDEEVIKNGTGTSEQKARLRQAVKHIKNANIHIEYISDFTVEDIENMIEKHIVRNNVGFVFFDYIQLTPALASSMQKSFGYSLREDQMLANLSASLKAIANKFDIFLATATQLNRSYKTDGEPDPTHLRGGMATADKADWGQISLRVGKKELEKIQPILDSGFTDIKPNMAHYIYKNRGGSRSGIIVWTQIDMNTIREKDCFVTTMDFELIQDIAPTTLIDLERE